MHLIEVRNPFDPHDRAIVDLGEHLLGEAAPQVLADLDPHWDTPYVLLHNGTPVMRADWGSTLVREGDVVTLLGLPAGGGGGGGGKQVMQAVAMIVIAVAAAYTGGAAAALYGGMATTAGMSAGAAASAGVMVAGSLLVNTMMPKPSLPSAQQAESAAAVSPTYNLQAQGNLARLGGAIPVQYGRVRAYLDYATAPYAEYQAGDQYLHQLFVVGVGEYVVDDIRFGDTPLTQLQDVSVAVYGPNTVPDMFPQQSWSSGDVGGQTLEQWTWIGPYTANPEDTLADAFAVDIIAPGGLYDGRDGGLAPVTVSYAVEWRMVDLNDNPLGAWVEAWSGSHTVRSAAPWRYSQGVAVSGSGRIQVRVRRADTKIDDPLVAHEIVWGALRSWSWLQRHFGNVTTLQIKARATNQLTAISARKVNALCTRKISPYRSGALQAREPTRSVAWALADLLGSEDGLNLPATRFDLADLARLDGEFAARGYKFDGRFDNQITAWEALTQVARAGRAVPYFQGGRIRFFRDTVQTVPTALFSMRNIVRGSLEVQYLIPSEATADAVEVTYVDEDVWRARQLTAATAGSTQEYVAKLDLFGVVQRAHAWEEADYLARANRWRRRVIKFTTEMDGFIPSIGDLIRVVHDMPGWGQAVEAEAWNAGTRTITLDAPLAWPAGPLYLMMRTRGGAPTAPILADRGGADNIAVFRSAPSITPDVGGQRERTHVVAGLGQRALVMAITPRSESQVEIVASNYDPRVYPEWDGTDPDPVDPNVPTPPPPPPPPPIDTGCANPAVAGLIAALVPGQDGVVSASWSGPPCADYYVVERSGDEVTWERIGQTAEQSIRLSYAPYGADLRIRVAAVGDNQGPWAMIRLRDVPGQDPDLEIPAPTDIVATPGIKIVFLEWTNNTSPRLALIEVWRSLTSDIADASLIARLAAPLTLYADPGAVAGVVNTYWLRSISSGGTAGPTSQPVSATPSKGFDIDDLIGELDESHLGVALNARLNWIDDPTFGLRAQVDRMRTGVGANLLEDVGLIGVDAADQTGAKWVRATNLGWFGASFGRDLAGNVVPGITEHVGYMRFAGARPTSGAASWSQDVPVSAGQWYQFNAWLQSLRCTAQVLIQFRSATASIGNAVSANLVDTGGNGETISGYTRTHVVGQAPTGAKIARVMLRATAATDANPTAFVLRPMFGEALANQADPSPWLPPIPDAFAFQKMYTDVYDSESGLGRLATLVQGVDSRVEDAEGDILGLAGAFQGFAAGVDVAYENRLIRSEEFELGWGRSAVTVAANALAVPQREATPGDAMRETAPSSAHFVSQDAIAIEPGYLFAASVHVRAVGTRHLVLRVVTKTSEGTIDGSMYYTYNLSTGAFIGASGVPAFASSAGWAVSLGDGWWRCAAVFAPTKNSRTAYLTLYSSKTAVAYTGAPVFAGSTAAGLDLFGAQINAGSRPDTYRKTTSVALFGPIHDRIKASSSAILAVDAQVNDPATGLPIVAGGYFQLQSEVNAAGGIATLVAGLQTGYGNGGNLLVDATFQNGLYTDSPWEFTHAGTGWEPGVNRVGYRLNTSMGENTPYIYHPGAVRQSTAYFGDFVQRDIPIEPGIPYQVSAYVGVANASVTLYVQYLNNATNPAVVGGFQSNRFARLTTGPGYGGTLLSGYRRIFGIGPEAPETAATARVFIRATYYGSGAQNNGYVYFVRPYLGVAKSGQDAPSPWAYGLEPPIFAAMQERGTVWANKDGAGALYTLKLRAQDEDGGAEVGFGLGAVKEANGQWVADVQFNATRFSIRDPTAAVGNRGRYPFIVNGGVVYMDTAVIRDGTIDTAKIGNAAITDAKIAVLAVSNAKIADLAVSNAKIANATIQGGKIANATLTNVNIVSGTINGFNIADLTLGTAKLSSGAAMFMVPFSINGASWSGAQFNFYAGGGGNDNTKIIEVVGFVRTWGASGYVPDTNYVVTVRVSVSNAVDLFHYSVTFRSQSNGFIPTTILPVYGLLSSAQLGGYNVGSRYILVQTSLSQPTGKAFTFDVFGSATMQKN